MPRLEDVLREAGGVRAGRDHAARLRDLLAEELRHGAGELELVRSGYRAPVTVAIAAGRIGLVAACPAAPQLRADPAATTERGWLVIAAVVGAMVRALALPAPAGAHDLSLRAGALDGWLAIALPLGAGEGGEAAELAALDFDDDVAGVDRLRARALALPGHAVEATEDLRPAIGATHPLRIAETVARLGGRPADEASVDAFEDAVLSLLAPPAAATRAHDDPDPVRRVARRMLQRLDGMGKWGGYHTEFAHLRRGFRPGNERALAADVAERLIDAGLLVEKVSVGQRHVFLNPRRSGEIHRLIDDGALPADLSLPDGERG